MQSKKRRRPKPITERPIWMKTENRQIPSLQMNSQWPPPTSKPPRALRTKTWISWQKSPHCPQPDRLLQRWANALILTQKTSVDLLRKNIHGYPHHLSIDPSHNCLFIPTPEPRHSVIWIHDPAQQRKLSRHRDTFLGVGYKYWGHMSTFVLAISWHFSAIQKTKTPETNHRKADLDENRK